MAVHFLICLRPLYGGVCVCCNWVTLIQVHRLSGKTGKYAKES